MTNIGAVAIYGGAMAGGADNPSNIAVKVTARRTKLAQATACKFQPVVTVNAGYYHADSCRVTIDGDPLAFSTLWSVTGTPGAGFALPFIGCPIQNAGIHAFFPAIGANTLFLNGNGAMVIPSASGNYAIDLDLRGWTFAQGQPFRLGVFNNNDHSRIVSIARNGTGMMLNADRTMRRLGEYLTLAYDTEAGKFVETGCLDQGV